MYRTNFGIGHDISFILNAHKSPNGNLGEGHINLYFDSEYIIILIILNYNKNL